MKPRAYAAARGLCAAFAAMLLLAGVAWLPAVAAAAGAASAAQPGALGILRGEGLPAAGPAGTAQHVDAMLPQPVPGELDTATRQAYQEALREYYRYRRSGLEHRQRVFAWQHWSSIVIFLVVLLLVGCGIYFAALQFHRDLRPRRSGETTAQAAGSSVELSASGLKVTSPVLGVIILVISLAFFYLYLAFVYPIREIL